MCTVSAEISEQQPRVCVAEGHAESREKTGDKENDLKTKTIKWTVVYFIVALSGGPLAKKYKFEQFHFHWGDKDSEGSEHRVNGKMYSAEVWWEECMYFF